MIGRKSCVFVLLLISLILFGGTVTAVRIPSNVRDCVTFIFVKDEKGKAKEAGTGFFVGVKLEENPERMAVYLVTAKHMLMSKEPCRYYNSIVLRMNKKAGGVSLEEVSVTDKIYEHEDPTVDIAVIRMLPSEKVFDYKVIPDEMLTTKEMFKKDNIRAGHEIFFTGLFTSFMGAERNHPIVRFGHVALITDEKISWENDCTGKKEKLDLYLIESLSFGGNSGSPVFFYAPKFALAGIMKGNYSQPLRIAKKTVDTSEKRTEYVPLQNAGIAAVVPAYRLHEILFSEELKERRKSKKQ